MLRLTLSQAILAAIPLILSSLVGTSQPKVGPRELKRRTLGSLLAATIASTALLLGGVLDRLVLRTALSLSRERSLRRRGERERERPGSSLLRGGGGGDGERDGRRRRCPRRWSSSSSSLS